MSTDAPTSQLAAPSASFQSGRTQLNAGAVEAANALFDRIDTDGDGVIDKQEMDQWHQRAQDGHQQELNESDKEKLTRHYSAIEQAFMQKVAQQDQAIAQLESACQQQAVKLSTVNSQNGNLVQECNRLQQIATQPMQLLRSQIQKQEADIRQLTSRSHQPDPSIAPSMTHNSPANSAAASSNHSAGNGWPTPRASASWQTPSTAAPPAYSTPSAAMAHSSIQSTPHHEPQFPQIDAMLSQLSTQLSSAQSADEILKQRSQRLDPTLDRLDRAIGRANSDVEQRARSTIRQQSPNRVRT